MDRPVLERSFAAEMATSAEAVELARAEAEGAGLSPAKVLAIEVAVEEAVTNVCRHAYRGGEGTYRIRLRGDRGAVAVEVEDDGPAFDPLAHADPDVGAPLAERPIGGLGILMIKKLVDEVSWRRDGGRNVLTMIVRP